MNISSPTLTRLPPYLDASWLPWILKPRDRIVHRGTCPLWCRTARSNDTPSVTLSQERGTVTKGESRGRGAEDRRNCFPRWSESTTRDFPSFRARGKTSRSLGRIENRICGMGSAKFPAIPRSRELPGFLLLRVWNLSLKEINRRDTSMATKCPHTISRLPNGARLFRNTISTHRTFGREATDAVQRISKTEYLARVWP